MEEKTNFLEKFWYLFVVLAIILVGVVGGLWFYNQKTLQESSGQTVPGIEEIITEETAPQTEEDAQTAALQQQSDSDEISQIEADIQATDLSNIDKELADIEVEIANP
ncbi:hypothetical protein MUP35_00565 [Patescibacteria group bacterium]|nr:hypothetical protein [Patescibacteria group bacterium]